MRGTNAPTGWSHRRPRLPVRRTHCRATATGSRGHSKKSKPSAGRRLQLILVVVENPLRRGVVETVRERAGESERRRLVV